VQNYNTIALAFYVGADAMHSSSGNVMLIPHAGFFVFEFPTVYISQRMRLAKYLGVNIVLWGVVLMLHSVASSFGSFFALRFILGERTPATFSHLSTVDKALQACVRAAWHPFSS
jgi:hypothetical protein